MRPWPSSELPGGAELGDDGGERGRLNRRRQAGHRLRRAGVREAAVGDALVEVGREVLPVRAGADRERVGHLERDRRVDVDRLHLRLRRVEAAHPRCSQLVSRPNGTFTPTPIQMRSRRPGPRGRRSAPGSTCRRRRPRCRAAPGTGRRRREGTVEPVSANVVADADRLDRRDEVPALDPREGRGVEVDRARVLDAGGLAGERVAEAARVLLDELEARREHGRGKRGDREGEHRREQPEGTSSACHESSW